MNVPSDLAEKVLQAGTRNVIADVGEGDKLTGPERDLMHMFAMNPDFAKRLRAFEHVKRWCKGDDLTAVQWAEVQEVYPEFRTGTTPPVELPPAPSFALQPEPPRKELNKARLEAWGKLYGCGARTARRYHAEGAPLDDPKAMPLWWESERAAGRKKWSVPEAVLLAAKNAETPPAETAVSAPTSESSPSLPQAAGESINLEDYDPEEGDNLRELKQLKTLAWAEIRRELKLGHSVAHLKKGVIEMEDMISRIQARIEDRLKKRGLFILRPEVERDLAKAAEMIRQMGESEVRRVLELCPDLPAENRDQVATAIRRVTAARAGVFRTMKNLRTTEDAVLQLAAA